MAEVVLATALALPLIFAFAELRGTQLAGIATEPKLADTPQKSSATPTAERLSSPVRVVLSGGGDGDISVRDSRVALLVEAISLAGNVSKSAAEGEAGPGTVNADEPVKTIAERVPLDRKAGRLTRPSLARVSETPSEPMQ